MNKLLAPYRYNAKHRAPEKYVGRHRQSEVSQKIGSNVVKLVRSVHQNLTARRVARGEARTELIREQRPEFRQSDTADITIKKGESLDLSSRAPLLTAEQVTQQLGGTGFGELQAVVELPLKESVLGVDYDLKHNPLYVFRSVDDAGETRFRCMSKRQVQQTSTMLKAGAFNPDNLQGNMLELGAGDEKLIGRAHWLPDVGDDVSLLDYDPVLANKYGAVSREQATLRVDERGALHVVGVAQQGTVVTAGPLVSSALHAPTGEFRAVA